MSQYILGLADPEAGLEAVGGKGMSLARLAQMKLPVPDGFHVTTQAYREFVTANDLQDKILAILTAKNLALPSDLEQAAHEIGKLFADGHIPEELAQAIRSGYERLGGSQAVAVRSSATAEDLPEASFAGQQETYLNISGVDEVLAAVKKCWASLWTARAIAYRARQAIDPDGVAMAVVVQELVAADAAGVMFTANPVNGKRTELVINAAWGLGESIVSGAVTPDTLTLNKASGKILSRETSTKHKMTVRHSHGTADIEVPQEKRDRPVLSDEQAADLCKCGLQIESAYGQPLDIEWAMTGTKFAILQARPITALPDEPLDWTPPDPKGIYMRASVVDLLPDPVSPLFATLGIPALVEQMNPMSQHLLHSRAVLSKDYFTTIHQYAYMNAYFPKGAWWWIITGMLPAYPRLLRRLVRYWREDAHPTYKTQVERMSRVDVGSLSPVELWQAIQELVNHAMYYVVGLQFATMGANAGSESLVTKMFSRMVKKDGDPPAEVLLMGWDNLAVKSEKSLFDLAEWIKHHPDLIALFNNETTGEIVERMKLGLTPHRVPEADWGELCQRFDTHIQQYGYHIFQLDFAADLPEDHPEPMIETLKMFVRGEGSNPYLRQIQGEQLRIQTTQLALTRLKGLKRWLFKTILNWGQPLSEVREDALAEIGLGYPLLRKMLLALGASLAARGIIDTAADIYWLEKDEIHQAVVTGDPARLTVRVLEQKAFLKRVKKIAPPPMIPMLKRYMGFDTGIWVAEAENNQSGNIIKGVAAGGGKVTAPARVLHGPEDFGKMKPGEVLVAGTTTPAWTPLFAMASAVVTDIGGPLSHGSIVAREYGIPAVMGTGVATRRIKNGQMITVDGSAGVVTL